MLLDSPELINDDPRRQLDPQPKDFAALYDAEMQRHGALVPSTVLPFCLGVSNQRVRQLVTGGVFTRIIVCGYEFVPLSEVEKRVAIAQAGKLAKGGRGHRAPALSAA